VRKIGGGIRILAAKIDVVLVVHGCVRCFRARKHAGSEFGQETARNSQKKELERKSSSKSEILARKLEERCGEHCS
jgi:hypothetical protein